jgi:hypothetical protein
VAIVNGYCTLAEVKAALRISDSVDDAMLERAVESASRRIDGYCGRFFFTKVATLDLFANNEVRLMVPDVSSTTGLTVSTDDNDDGTFETVWTLNVDYKVLPTDAVLQAYPYTSIMAIGNKTFPGAFYPWRGIARATERPLVRVAATYGWAAVPHDVREAAIMLSVRQYARLNAPLGVLGFGDMAVSVRSVDPDVRDLLQPYRRIGIV